MASEKIITKPSTEAYRRGWERIFGKKKGGFMHYKVPFRNVIVFSFRSWLRATAWCLIVKKLWPKANCPNY